MISDFGRTRGVGGVGYAFRHRLGTVLLLILSALCKLAAAAPPVAPLLLCGADEVFVIDAASSAGEKLWTWRAKDRQDLPEPMRGLFNTTDECKPLPREAGEAARILISSSGGGCALVEYPSGRVLWHARVPNAHSIEWLPRDRIVVASSVHADGNRLVIFDVSRPGQPLAQSLLPSAHGVVWDPGRQRLWALGLKELNCYRLKDWDTDQPALELDATYRLADEEGHDLQALPRGNELTVSTARHVYLFDREKREFRTHPQLGDVKDVKSVSFDAGSGRVVFLHGDGGDQWWTETVHCLAPGGEIRLAGQRLYKARWLTMAGKS